MCISFGITTYVSGAEPIKVGAGQAYATLNEAISAAQEGQAIQIVGNVTESNPALPVLIDKRVIIRGDGSSVYTVKSWAKEESPFKIEAAGVVIEDLNILINGGATTASPIEISADNFTIKRGTITLTGSTSTAFSPITLNATGLVMEDVTMPATNRAQVVLNLKGNNAIFRRATITTGANTTGIYSNINLQSLVLEDCIFNTTANSANTVLLPTPEGLTLSGCTFTLNYSGTAGTGYGLSFTQASDSAVTKALILND